MRPVRTRLVRLVTRPAAITASLLSLAAFVASPGRTANREATVAFHVGSPERYTVTYTAPTGGATAGYFPSTIVLLPGTDSGAVLADGAGAKGHDYWHAFGRASRWHGLGPDSVAIDLTNGVAHIDIRATRAAGGLAGRATYRESAALPGLLVSMRLDGVRSR